MPISFWKSPNVIEQFNHLDRTGFAAEFLRRNDGYRDDYARTHRQIARGRVDPNSAKSDLARRWGLRFCPRP